MSVLLTVFGAGSCWKPGRPIRSWQSRCPIPAFQSHSQIPGVSSSLSFNQAMQGGQGIFRSPISPRQFSEIPWQFSAAMIRLATK